MEITIRRGERLYGPYSVEQIHGMLDAGSVVLQDHAWSESEGRWTTIRQIVASTPSPSDSGVDPAEPTLDDLLGNPPTSDALSSAQEVDPAKQKRIANVLMAVGLIAIALGTFNIALHMKATEKSRSAQGSSQASPSRSDDDSNASLDAARKGTDKPPR
jgi:hypothetical protein